MSSAEVSNDPDGKGDRYEACANAGPDFSEARTVTMTQLKEELCGPADSVIKQINRRANGTNLEV